MGYMKVAAKIYNPTDRSKLIHLELLADTGAIYATHMSRRATSIRIVPKVEPTNRRHSV